MVSTIRVSDYKPTNSQLVTTMTENNNESKLKPEISKIEYNFPTEDELRLNRHGQKFEDIQESEIEFVNANRRVASEDDNDAVRIWLENGSHIRYELVDEHTVIEATYRSDDPSSVFDRVEISLTKGGRVDFISCVEIGIEEYLSSRRKTVEDFKGDWTTVYEILR